MSNDRGVFCISRKLFDPDDPFFGGEPFTRREAWLWLLSEAAWKPRRIRIGTGRGTTFVDIERGQLSASLKFMQRAWKWSSVKRVRTFLSSLEMDTRIGRPSGTASDGAQSIITICKYDEYQFPVPSGGEPSGTASDIERGTARARQGHETKKDNKYKKRNTRSRAENPDQFEQWYGTYPKKVDRKDAERSFNRLMATGEITFPDLLAATSRFVAAVAGTDPKYIKAPAVWINKGSYLDNVSATAATAKIEEPTRDPRTFTDDEWRAFLKRWNVTREWSLSYWGPKPGEPDCLVPRHLLVVGVPEVLKTGTHL
jgi:hypothetical protein